MRKEKIYSVDPHENAKIKKKKKFIIWITVLLILTAIISLVGMILMVTANSHVMSTIGLVVLLVGFIPFCCIGVIFTTYFGV